MKQYLLSMQSLVNLITLGCFIFSIRSNAAELTCPLLSIKANSCQKYLTDYTEDVEKQNDLHEESLEDMQQFKDEAGYTRTLNESNESHARSLQELKDRLVIDFNRIRDTTVGYKNIPNCEEDISELDKCFQDYNEIIPPSEPHP